jgi:hypothetical protein
MLIGHKVLTWYFARRREGRTRRVQKEAVVAPPVGEERVDEGGKCGICTGKLRTATMVRPTGYVYCWECIGNYVRKEGRCPLGRVEVAADQLQILYD